MAGNLWLSTGKICVPRAGAKNLRPTCLGGNHRLLVRFVPSPFQATEWRPMAAVSARISPPGCLSTDAILCQCLCIQPIVHILDWASQQGHSWEFPTLRNQDSQGQTFVDLDPWQQLEGEWIKKRPSHRWATTQPSDALALGQPGSTFAISHRCINFLHSNFYDVEDQRKTQLWLFAAWKHEWTFEITHRFICHHRLSTYVIQRKGSESVPILALHRTPIQCSVGCLVAHQVMPLEVNLGQLLPLWVNLGHPC